MKKLNLRKSTANDAASMGELVVECWFNDSSILDMDYFVKTLSEIKAKGVRPNLIGSIITSYASKWLPELSDGHQTQETPTPAAFEQSPDGVLAQWMKKRFFIETLVGILPPEKASVSCNFLLRLLRTGKMVGVMPTYLMELEKKVSWQLDQASLKELMIPSFSHTRGTLLDVDLVLRLVKRYVNMDEATKSEASLFKVTQLVDSYLAEAALDSNFALSEFIALAGALPSHARSTDDGLYQAVDTYLKVHSNTSKEDRHILCRFIDGQKLSSEASLHAAQNDRLPVRTIMQVIFSEQARINRQIERSGSLNGSQSLSSILDLSGRFLSKHKGNTQHIELKKLREDVHKLQSQCNSIQAQIEKPMEKKRNGFLQKMKRGFPLFRAVSIFEKIDRSGGAVDREPQTQIITKVKSTQGRNSTSWRKPNVNRMTSSLIQA